MPLLDDVTTWAFDAVATVGTWLLTPAGAMTATGLGVASALVAAWQLARGKRSEPVADMPSSQTPGIADRLKARYGTGFPAFSTLDQIDKIMAERTLHFFGREDQLAYLDAFVRDHERGILVLAAPGGFGKSCLLANWGLRREAQGGAVAYHLFNATAGRTVQRADAFTGLRVQIAALRGRPVAR